MDLLITKTNRLKEYSDNSKEIYEKQEEIEQTFNKKNRRGA